MAYRVGQIVKQVNNNYYSQDPSTHEYIISEGCPNVIAEAITPRYGIQYLNRFGIQSRPGALFAIDGEVIMIGRSGTYEIYNDLIQVSKLQMLSEGTFIIDFKY